jgi:hypothetical protein
MNRLARRILIMAAGLAGNLAFGQATIFWNSEANKFNLTSAGQAMDGGFRFELGVFDDGFVPSPGNVADWAAHWTAAQRRPYDAANKLFSGSHIPPDNNTPFAVNAPAYVWGFRGDGVINEWILFRAVSWTWPDASSFPYFEEWFAKDATAIVGEINSTGNPFLMKFAAVANAAPPATTWDQWRAEFLDNEPLDGPGDDPDHDGTPNLLEFVFGSPPRSANPPTATPVALVSGHLEITIPRRIDRRTNLVVEVSGDLANWFSGPPHTAVLTDSPAALVVRDLTPFDAAHPRRFMRLRAAPPGP